MTDNIFKTSFKKNVSKAFSFFKKKVFEEDVDNNAFRGKEHLYSTY